jgi:hypothetical protein
MSILFGTDIPSYEEQLELCRRLNAAAGRHRKTKQPPPAATRINRHRRYPYLAWVNPRPPRPRKEP